MTVLSCCPKGFRCLAIKSAEVQRCCLLLIWSLYLCCPAVHCAVWQHGFGAAIGSALGDASAVANHAVRILWWDD